MIGREEEIERVIQILSRRTKNNPALIGEAGERVGKVWYDNWRAGTAQRAVSGVQGVPVVQGFGSILASALGVAGVVGMQSAPAAQVGVPLFAPAQKSPRAPQGRPAPPGGPARWCRYWSRALRGTPGAA